MQKLFSLIAILIIAIFIFQSCNNSKKITGNADVIFQQSQHPYRFMFYNVENLFDTIDNPNKNDEEFLPSGSMMWTSFRYYSKLQKISKVVIALGQWKTPDLIGLCEIESREAIDDLLRLTPLNQEDYGIIHKESPDYRGIDVALLYKRETFQPLFYDFYKIDFPFSKDTKTREVLYAKGLLGKTDTLNIFIVHFPSRRGGKVESEPKRIFVSKMIKTKVDSILNVNPEANILISGDFNDEPFDNSILKTLNANADSNEVDSLNNLMGHLKKEGIGSYKYGYEWNMLDQIIVSKSLIDKNNGIFTYFNSARIFKDDWLLVEDTKYNGNKPFRTYYGPNYQGGYSDHLPVYVDIYKNITRKPKH